jgi:F0F1-type ATP synthase membrane subunit b/b'
MSIGSIDLALGASFSVFALWSVIKGRRYAFQEINAYRQDIQKKFDLAEKALVESRQEWDQCQQSYTSLDAQKNDMLTLAGEEVDFIWEKIKQTAHNHQQQLIRNVEHLYLTHQEKMHQDLKNQMWAQIQRLLLDKISGSASTVHEDFFFAQGQNFFKQSK